MPDAEPLSGSIQLGRLQNYRCVCCRTYIQAAEFNVPCQYHPGIFGGPDGQYGSVKARTYHWSCCKDPFEEHPGCKKKTTHTEDIQFSKVLRSLGSSFVYKIHPF